jgi:phosphoribosylaminoimidazole-succinocarboxamide synthase
MLTGALHESNIERAELLFRGKVRDVYDLDDSLLLVATDRLSAFDVVLPTPIPGKGRILTEMSNFWFAKTEHLIANHLTHRDVAEVIGDEDAGIIDGRGVIARKTEPLKIEAIVRGYLAGSGWKEYQENGTVCGIPLPEGLQESSRLPEPIFTPSTKAAQGLHDENISFEIACDIVGVDIATKVRDTALTIYNACAEHALERGLILADTKMEFGILPDGEMILIDELLTPDSSRFWDVETYAPGGPQPAFDKQYIRDWLISIGFNKQPPAPEVPPEVVKKTVEKYMEAMRRLTS